MPRARKSEEGELCTIRALGGSTEDKTRFECDVHGSVFNVRVLPSTAWFDFDPNIRSVL
jgi:hypothetical protein